MGGVEVGAGRRSAPIADTTSFQKKLGSMPPPLTHQPGNWRDQTQLQKHRLGLSFDSRVEPRGPSLGCGENQINLQSSLRARGRASPQPWVCAGGGVVAVNPQFRG